MFSADGSGRPRVLVRDAADINRVVLHLFTRWTLPRVEIQFDSLAPVVVQRAQYRFARISEGGNYILGVALAAITLLGGSYGSWASIQSWIWTSAQFWQHLGLVAVAALGAGLIGWMIEAAWTRVRLMLVLHRLRRRLAAGKAVDEPARYRGRVSSRPAGRSVRPTAEADTAHEDPVRHPAKSGHGRPRLLVRNSTDRRRLAVHLFTHRTLPRIEIGVDGVATLEVQRAQHRIAELSGTCGCVLAAVLAMATLLGGSFWVTWISSANWQWWASGSWGPLGLVAVAAPCAALLGWVIEMVWIRVKLMLVLRGVRAHAGT